MNKSALILCAFLILGTSHADEEIAQTNVYYPQQGTAYPQQAQINMPARSNKDAMEQKWRDYQNYNVVPNTSNADYYPVQSNNYYQNYGVPPPGQQVAPVYPQTATPVTTYPNVSSPHAYPVNNVPANAPVYTNPNVPHPVYTNPNTPVYTNPTGTYPNGPYVNPNVTNPNYTNPNVTNPNVVAPPNQGVIYHPTYAPPPGGYGIGPNQQQGAVLRNFDQIRNTTINSDQGSYQPGGQMSQKDKLKYRAVKQQEELMKRQLKQQEGLNR